MKKWEAKAALTANVRRLQIERRQKRRKARIREKRLQIERAVDDRRRFAFGNNILFDQNLQRQAVILPEVFSFSENHEDTATVLATIRSQALHEGKPLLLHFEHVKKTEAAASLALVAEIYRVRNLRRRSLVSGTYPRNKDVYAELSKMGFFKLLDVVDQSDRPDNALDPEKPIYLPFVTDNRAEWVSVDRFVEIVEKHVLAFDDRARQRLVRAIGEAITNTSDHAHPEGSASVMKGRWWLSARVNVPKREMAIVVFDQGVGIPNTLPPTDYEQLRAFFLNALQFRLDPNPTDGEMILAATAYRRSGTGSEGRGRGFQDMKDFVDVCSDGELRVLSNRGSYHYMGGQETFQNSETSISGTLIEWRFSHDGVVELKDE